MIELKNISKTYDDKKYAVKDLNLKIEKGMIYTFVGPSGCGKSTTLKMINRLIEPTEGDIYINGININKENPNELRKNIGYVIQETGLLPHKTIEENISIVPKLHKWDKERIQNRIKELIELMGLDRNDIYDKYPSQLSGGQMQRIGVARALAVDPPIMLMDEPFGAVDPIVRVKLQDEFLRLQNKTNKTICFVTHDINEAFKMGDKVVIFNNGNIVQCDTPENIILKPKNKFVESFVGSNGLIDSLKVLPLSLIIDNRSFESQIKDVEKIDKFRKNNYILDSNESIERCLDLFFRKNIEEIIIEHNGSTYPLKLKDLQNYLSEEVY